MLFSRNHPHARPGRKAVLATGFVGVLAFSLLAGVLPANAQAAETSPVLSASDIAALKAAVETPEPLVVTEAATDAVANISGTPSDAVLKSLVTPSVVVDDGVAIVGESVGTLPTPEDNTLSLSNGSNGAAIVISIVGATTTEMSGDAAVTQSVDPGTSVISHITPEGGIQLLSVTQTATPQVKFGIETTIPEGTYWDAQADGSLRLIDPTQPAGQNIVIVAAAPWAIDARGTHLPTQYVVTGGTINQLVDSSAAVFPVVADPTVLWWVATIASCVLAVAAFAVPFGKVALSLVAAQRVISGSVALTKIVNGLGGLKAALVTLGKFVSNASKLSATAQLGIKGLIAFGINTISEILGIGSCVGLAKATFGWA